MDTPAARLTLPPKPAAGFHPELQFTRSYRDHVPYFTQTGQHVALDVTQRMAAAKRGQALTDGSWPIRNAVDLHHALEQFRQGHHTETVPVRSHIMRRAAQLGLEKTLPVHWIT